jgi:hypothetical protein
LYPFDWEPPRRVTNGAQLIPVGGIRFPKKGIVRSKGPPAWIASAKQSHRLELLLRVRCFSANQNGPARIITLSSGPYLRDFTVGQEGDDLIFRLRTPRTSLNGTFNGMEFVQLPDVFKRRGWIDLRILVMPGRLQITVENRVRVRKLLPRLPLQDWDTSYRLALGNELTYDRPWLGEIRRASVQTKGEAVDYVNPNNVELPSRVWILPTVPNLLPFRDFDLQDALLNVIAYIPLGLLLGELSRRPIGLRGWYPVLIVFAVSLTMEVMQVFMSRYPSISDPIFNTFGGAVGLLLARNVSGLTLSAC